MSHEQPAELEAPHVLAYDYTRSTGDVLGAFFTGLRERRVMGIRDTRDRVLVPPRAYDPATAEELDELVEVGDAGEVLTWTWQQQPRDGQPLDRPFAWALIRLDGADTGMLHAVDAASPEHMAVGLRVRARWAEDRQGQIHDLVCFVPEEDA